MADAAPNTQIVQPCDDQKTWIEIRLVDLDNQPVPGETYQIRLPDSSLMEGVLDEEGKARFDNIVAGDAAIKFVNIHGDEWHAL